jgi:hypothetical protein
MSTALDVPPYMNRALTEVRKHPEMGAAVRALEERGEMDALRTSLAGTAMVPAAREHLDAALDARWARAGLPRSGVAELVVGGGLHAAIYCAVRAAKGALPPLVVEARERVGGAMAYGARSGFYLNSRNRPGSLSYPGFAGALNVLPAAPLQPSDISGDEYQRSVDLAFVIRATLGMTASVCSGMRVVSVLRNTGLGKRRWRATFSDGRHVDADRVILASGIGEPVPIQEGALIDFPGLMRLMDEPFPLRGLRRVAVVGAGDSGKTAVESLAGQGPSTGWSPASLDWYGVPDGQTTRGGWEDCNRSRYKGIGALLPRGGGDASLVRPLIGRAGTIGAGFNMAFVNDRPYDLVIDCRGFSPVPLSLPGEASPYAVGGRIVGARIGASYNGLFAVGPGYALALSDYEQADFGATPESSTALFRYAERTAAAAASFGIG